MARSINASPSHSLAKRLGAGLAGVALAAVLAGCATPYASGAPDGSAKAVVHDQSEIIIVCGSGIVTGPDGVETSSQVVSRIPAGDPIPAGCIVA
jgi:hypothetical protein